MASVLDIIGGLSLVSGGLFMFLGGLGLLRMPDLFNRIQVGAKAPTLGTILIFVGAACLRPEWWVKLLLISLFMLYTNPLSSHVLARTAHRSGERMSADTKVDHLAEEHEEHRVDP